VCVAQFGRASAQTTKQVLQMGDFYHQRGFYLEGVAQREHILAEVVNGCADQEPKMHTMSKIIAANLQALIDQELAQS
jgi:hypothetical protein